jgi:hypothetical protein
MELSKLGFGALSNNAAGALTAFATKTTAQVTVPEVSGKMLPQEIMVAVQSDDSYMLSDRDIIDRVVSDVDSLEFAGELTQLFPVSIIFRGKPGKIWAWFETFTSARANCSRALKAYPDAISASVLCPIADKVWAPDTIENPAVAAKAVIYRKINNDAIAGSPIKMKRKDSQGYAPTITGTRKKKNNPVAQECVIAPTEASTWNHGRY